MPAFAIVPLSEFPGLVSALKNYGQEYRRLKAVRLPLSPSWIVPASAWEEVLRQNGKQVLLRQLMANLKKPGSKSDLKTKNQIRRLITHLDIDVASQNLLGLYHRHLKKGQVTLRAFLPTGYQLVTTPPEGDANFIQTTLVLWAKSCIHQALTATTMAQLAPHIVISHVPTPQWQGEIYCRHSTTIKHSAVLIKLRANRKNSTTQKLQIDSQTLQFLHQPSTGNQISLWRKITHLIRPTHPRRLNSALRQLAHIGGKLGRLTAYPAKAEFVITPSGIFLTEVELRYVE